MRSDVFIETVLEKCEVLKRSNFWLGEPRMRPNAWLHNFETNDRPLAARLLDRFIFYRDPHTDYLLVAAYKSIFDHGVRDIRDALVTPVQGEVPNPSDSGYIFCRKARQVLGVHEALLVNLDRAIENAEQGKPVLFIDDFVGSGDQFVRTWKRKSSKGISFEDIAKTKQFAAIYVALVATKSGRERIESEVPTVLISVAHQVDKLSSVFELHLQDYDFQDIDSFLSKYSKRLAPNEQYIRNNPDWLKYGYKSVGLMLGFEHSVPDATLPLFWSPGRNDEWVRLIERI